MSTEEFDPRSQNNKIDLAEENDPIAELARIVAGEEESFDAQTSDNGGLDESLTSQLPESSYEKRELSMEEQLIQELGASDNAPQALDEEDDFAASIQEQMEAQLAANEAPAQVAEVAVGNAPAAPHEAGVVDSVSAQAQAQSQPTPVADMNEDVAFQDDLIEALQEEINPAPQAVEATISETIESVELVDEFEQQMAAEQEIPQALHAPAAAISEEQIVVEPQPVEENAEIDFGSAFAEELGVDTVNEVQGWTAEDETRAADDFSLAAQPVGANTTVDMEPEYIHDMTGSEPEHDPLAMPEEQKSGGSFKYAMAALVIALFAGAGTAVYGFLGDGDEVTVAEDAIIIRADAQPVKVKPDDPGGHVPDNQDKASYNKVGGVEEEVDQSTLLSNTEQPAVIDVANATQEAIDQAQSSLAAAVNNGNKVDDRLNSGGEESSATNISSSVAPKRVTTLVIKPDGTIAENQQQSNRQQVATSSNTLGLAPAPEATPRQVSTSLIKPNQPIDGARSTQNIGVPNVSPLPKPKVAAVQPAAPAPKPAAQPSTASTTVARSEWVVQVASQTSPEAAQASFQTMRNRYSSLQNRSMSVQRAAVNGRTYYRVRVQTASRNDANQLCSRLTAQGGSCFVTR